MFGFRHNGDIAGPVLVPIYLFRCTCPLAPFHTFMLPPTPPKTQEKRLARKREDFEKMKEISAHMDNIVHRLAAFFPREDANAHGPTAATELPALPIPPPDKAVHRSVSARVMTMDRAVSARQLTTDRAISVASGMHFDDELSGAIGRRTCYCGRRWDLDWSSGVRV